jgi:ATP-binding cassette, subfamily G (WHITE), member 2
MNFDYIVVGGGSSGSTLAAHLVKKGPTLLIERGRHHSSFPQSQAKEGFPQLAALAFTPLRATDSGHWSGTASILGGGSGVNAAACWRGQPAVFDDLGFSGEEAQRALERVEDQFCDPAPDTEFNAAFVDAWRELDFNTSEDILDGAGLASWTANKNHGGVMADNIQVQRAGTLFTAGANSRRRLASNSFDIDATSTNLTVMLQTTAKRIVFDKDKTAKAVQVENPIFGDLTVSVRRGGKIFLNAGGFETPKLLMLSGVGPRAVLEEFGIQVVKDSPAVGQNAIDRKEVAVGIPMLQNLDGDDTALLDFAAFGQDYWASFAHRQAGPWGDAAFGCLSCAPVNRTQGCMNAILSGLLLFGLGVASPESRSMPIISVAQREPTTRGFVTLSSGDYKDSPTFFDGWDYRNLSAAARHDLDVLVNATERLVVSLLGNTTLLEKLGHPVSNRTGNFSSETSTRIDALRKETLKIETLASATCNVDESRLLPCHSWDDCVPTMPTLPRQRDTLRETIKNIMASSHHISGTTKVGDVVDVRTLAVKGVLNLYVADLSVIARPVDIHPMVTAMAIGDLIGSSVDAIPPLSMEKTPIILAFLLLCASAMFSLYVILSAVFRGRLNSGEESKEASTLREDSLDDNHCAYSRAIGGQIDLNEDEATKTEHSSNPDVEGEALISWFNVGCSYPSKRSKKEAVTLTGSTGVLRSKELVAIMGQSGGGKSTLLDILSLRKTLGNLTGELSILGEHVDDISSKTKDSRLQKYSAYIPQQDIFFPTQTPQEAVAFVANLRLGKEERGTIVRQQFIHSLLDKVGLGGDVRLRPIGGGLPGGIVIRGLSGGERKRLSLACALAMKPKILFLDEITSGLDSENALLTMKLLKRLCLRVEIAAAVVIHQPSPEVFQLFDRLVLLSSGKTVFSGKTTELLDFYNNRLMFPMPEPNSLPGDLLKQAKTAPTIEQSQSAIAPTSEDSVHTEAERKSPSVMWKFKTVFERNLINQCVRNPTNLAGRVIIYGGLALVTGAIYWQVAASSFGSDSKPAEEAATILGALTFLVMLSYLLPFSAVSLFVQEKQFFVNESSLGLYSPWFYCVSQIILESWILVLVSILQASIMVPMIGYWNVSLPRWASFFTVLSSIAASSIVGSANVLFFSIALPSQDLAFLAGAAVVTVSLSVSGGFVPVPSIPSYMRWLQWISPCKYSLQALSIHQFEGSRVEYLLDEQGLNHPGTIAANIGALFLMFAVLAVCTMVALSRQREVR